MRQREGGVENMTVGGEGDVMNQGKERGGRE